MSLVITLPLCYTNNPNLSMHGRIAGTDDENVHYWFTITVEAKHFQCENVFKFSDFKWSLIILFHMCDCGRCSNYEKNMWGQSQPLPSVVLLTVLSLFIWKWTVFHSSPVVSDFEVTATVPVLQWVYSRWRQRFYSHSYNSVTLNAKFFFVCKNGVPGATLISFVISCLLH